MVGIFYDFIKQLCEKKGVSIAGLERDAGLGNGVIAGWRDGEPKLSSIVKIADVFGMTPSKLIDEFERFK